MAIETLIKCIMGPRLFRIYRNAEREGRTYSPNALESYSDNIIYSLSIAWSVGFYISPVIFSLLFRRAESLYSLGRFAGIISLLFLGIYCLRGLGRFSSQEYKTFLHILDAAKRNFTSETKLAMSQYDFEFYAWPADFTQNLSSLNKYKSSVLIEKAYSRRKSYFDDFRGLPCNFLSYVVMHTFGRRMVYPGAVKLLQSAVAPMLLQGRTKLIEEYNAQRNKLITSDGNEIDSVFVDRRNMTDMPNGNIIVICCEGNAGFYEYGIMCTPLEAGYSVLGWNHPGFAGSTGVPFPSQETKAIDAVMDFAISKLGFKINQIIVFAWSIGGYSASWAAMSYPDIKGLVLDATFDDILHLALAKMPPSWKPLVVRSIRDYMDLNIGEQVCRYYGPILLVRRSRDEIISTKETSPTQTNRGNDLLIKLLQSRYPKLVTEETLWALKDWLSGDKEHQSVVWHQQDVEDVLCQASLASYIEENCPVFPLMIGEDMPVDMKIQLVLYLAHKYMIDFDSTHCTPLPGTLFSLPWDLKMVGNEKLCPSNIHQDSHL